MSVPRVFRNDWSTLRVPELDRWRPELTVSVVIPAYRCQASLDLTLASLARQTYPADLLEVVVVDDGSAPALELPTLRPRRCRLLRVPSGWGRANALRHGAEQSSGEILHWLDADMVVFPEHVAAQARWHHVVPYAVTLGWKRFVDVAPDRPGWPSPEQPAEELFQDVPSEPHDYVERYIARTDQLRAADHLAFMIHVGATAALRRELYEAAGGLDPELKLGEDTEFGYRLAQAGAVFVPEPAARAWHLGATHMMRHQDQLRRYNRPHLADRMPQPRWLRKVGGSGWAVPLVTAVVEVAGRPLERVRAAVDALLRGDEQDLRVLLVGPWDTLSDERMSPLSDPDLDLRLVAATYRSDPRVRLVQSPPESVFPSPFLLRVPVDCGLTRPALGRLVDVADRHQLGLVRVPVGSAGTVELWRTAALGRARFLDHDGVSLAEVVTATHGADTVAADRAGIVDLSGYSEEQLAGGIGALPDAHLPTGRWLPTSVEVAGVRSLARATAVVARLTAHRATARVRRLLTRR